jgi:hypothetical protein
MGWKVTEEQRIGDRRQSNQSKGKGDIEIQRAYAGRSNERITYALGESASVKLVEREQTHF